MTEYHVYLIEVNLIKNLDESVIDVNSYLTNFAKIFADFPISSNTYGKF